MGHRPAASSDRSSAQNGEERIREYFRRGAEWTATTVGSYWAFTLAVAVVAVWAVTGPVFGFSDSWQLVINTGTTIVTFLMVFLIQNTQNRSAKLMELKLDELLRGVEGARTGFVDLDHMTDEELEEVRDEFNALPEKYAPLIESHVRNIEAALVRRKARKQRRNPKATSGPETTSRH